MIPPPGETSNVFLTAGGKTQMREQAGGMHLFAQDTKIVHFGTGAAGRVDEVRVRWPSGLEQRRTDFTCDRYITFAEP